MDAPTLLPPSQRIPVLRWLKQNLFSNWYNALLSLVTLAVVLVVGYGLLRWALTGADWAVIPANLKGFLVGTYAWDQLWRVWATLYMVALFVGFGSGLHQGLMRRIAQAGVVITVALAALPFDWATRAWIMGVTLSIVTGFGVGWLSRRASLARNVEVAFWVASLPLTFLMLIGVGPLTVTTGARWGITLDVVALLWGISAALRGGRLQQASGFLVGGGWLGAGVAVVLAGWSLAEVWHWAAPATAAYAMGLVVGVLSRNRLPRWGFLALWTLPVWVALALFTGAFEAFWNGGVVSAFPTEVDDWDKWGFLINIAAAVFGIGLSLPIGVLLALGRRSHLPAVRLVCTAYIELIRGVPLISLLFMASNMLPLLIPGSFRPDIVIRAMVTITAFTAAYMAENVRGGLQAIPKGQMEAAYAVGLNGVLTTLLIVLPQALRNVIPAIVGQFIALFKDTTLFGFVAIIEVLAVGRSVYGGLEWRGRVFEIYIFMGFLFWVFCYSMSYISRRVEKSLGVGER